MSGAAKVHALGVDVSLKARRLTSLDAEALRAIRLEALKREGQLFGPTYEHERAIADVEWWGQRCMETDSNCIFGLFDNENSDEDGLPLLVGIMGAKRWDKDEEGKTALWWTAYVRPAYRGLGNAAELYQLREQWTVEKGFSRVVFFIVEGNVRSAEIHLKHGAHYTHSEPIPWPDRPTMMWRWYEKALSLPVKAYGKWSATRQHSIASSLPRQNIRATVRCLGPDDARAYRALRKRILDIGDGRFFSDSYEREGRLLTDQQWRDWCTESREHGIIGTFVDGQLAGVMAITQQWPALPHVVEWEATWLAPEYRGFGIAKQAYDEVRSWTIAHGYEFAAVFIRDDNWRSREIREKQGFEFISTKHNETWADGSLGDVDFLLLALDPARQGEVSSIAARIAEVSPHV